MWDDRHCWHKHSLIYLLVSFHLYPHISFTSKQCVLPLCAHDHPCLDSSGQHPHFIAPASNYFRCGTNKRRNVHLRSHNQIIPRPHNRSNPLVQRQRKRLLLWYWLRNVRRYLRLHCHLPRFAFIRQLLGCSFPGKSDPQWRWW
jgi:hypothetical protein